MPTNTNCSIVFTRWRPEVLLSNSWFLGLTPERHLDQFSRSCQAHQCEQLTSTGSHADTQYVWPTHPETDTQTTLRQYTCRNSPHPALSMHAKISQPHRSFDSVSLRFAKILGRFKVTALWYSVWEDPWRRVVRSQTISMRRCSRLQQCWLWIDLSTCYSISNIP